MAEQKKDASSEVKSSEPAPTSTTDPVPTAVPVEDAPDPDEDDLDDLDEMLDEFSAKPAPAPAPAPVPASSEPDRPASGKEHADAPTASGPAMPPGLGLPGDLESEEFTAQLQKEMEALMSHVDENPDMKNQMEKLFSAMVAEGEKNGPIESPDAAMAFIDQLSANPEGAKTQALSTGAAAGAGVGAASKGAANVQDKPAAEKSTTDKAPVDENFQDTIRRTMERMKLSDSEAGAAASQSKNAENDLMAQLLQELAAGEGGDGNEEDFSKMLLGMMEQLTNKEILYEPMKDLHDRYPKWLEENKGKVDDKEFERYSEQSRLVNEIVGRFEKSGYSDENAQDREFIVERMQQMQAIGSPPPDLVGNMDEAHNVLGDLDAGCPQQ